MIKVYQTPAPEGRVILMAKPLDWEVIAGRISPIRFHQPHASVAIRQALAETPDQPMIRITFTREEAEQVLAAAGR